MHDEELADAMSRVAPVAAEPRTLEESLREVGVVGGNLTAALWLTHVQAAPSRRPLAMTGSDVDQMMDVRAAVTEEFTS